MSHWCFKDTWDTKLQQIIQNEEGTMKERGCINVAVIWKRVVAKFKICMTSIIFIANKLFFNHNLVCDYFMVWFMRKGHFSPVVWLQNVSAWSCLALIQFLLTLFKIDQITGRNWTKWSSPAVSWDAPFTRWRRMKTKFSPLRMNELHPLKDSLKSLTSSFNELLHSKCVKEKYRKFLVSAAVRLYNQLCSQ